MSVTEKQKQNLIQWKPGQSGNPKGKLKGCKSLATIVRELENEDFDWDKIPVASGKFKKAIDALSIMGSPWRAIVTRATIDALGGDKRAMEWLRKSGYGDKLDVTSKGREMRAPAIITPIPPRNEITGTETEATEGS